jgi:hypothetical protein
MALSKKTTERISFSTMYTIFAVMVVVLPVPAPARIRALGVFYGFKLAGF